MQQFDLGGVSCNPVTGEAHGLVRVHRNEELRVRVIAIPPKGLVDSVLTATGYQREQPLGSGVIAEILGCRQHRDSVSDCDIRAGLRFYACLPQECDHEVRLGSGVGVSIY